MNDPRVQQLHQFVDEQMTRLATMAVEKGRPISCGKLCAACCSEPVYVDMREVLHALHGLTAAEREYVIARTREWVDTVPPSGLLSVHQPLASEYRKLRIACPFLKDSLCLVYDRRPIACRLHNSISGRAVCENIALRPQSVSSPEVLERVMLVSLKLFHGGADLDHLGVWLAGFLLNTFLKSADRLHIPQQQGREIADHITLEFTKE